MWREIIGLSKNASFAIREQAGHSLKSALRVRHRYSGEVEGQEGRKEGRKGGREGGRKEGREGGREGGR